jgi:hypothetical protein
MKTDFVEPTILANDIKSGTHVRLNDGREVIVKDNLKGLIRMIEAPIIGMPGCTEMGSCYAQDWYSALINNVWIKVELTPDQLKQAQKIEVMRNW